MNGLSQQFPVINAGFALPVRAFSSTRLGGVSRPPFDALNLSANTDDDPEHVRQNRTILNGRLPGEPHWLRQVHGRQVIHLDDWQPGAEADAAWTDRPGQVVAVLTADCLPILLAGIARSGSGPIVAAIHAGWRGLAFGVIEHTLEQLATHAQKLQAWIGPSIRQPAYEVDEPVFAAFKDYPNAFSANGNNEKNGNRRWQADLQSIARQKLMLAGIKNVRDCGLCTAGDRHNFYSHRRDGRCGRQASLIWFE